MADDMNDADTETGSDTDTDTDTGAESDAEGSGPTVLLTVMDNRDGTFTLIKGDEADDEDEEGEGDAAGETSDEEGAEGDEGAGAAGAGEEAGAEEGTEGEESQGQTFDSPGPLLKAILDMVKEAEEKSSGEGSADDQFSAGYGGDQEPTPATGSSGRRAAPGM